MQFRKDSISFWQAQIPCIILPFFALALFQIAGWQFLLFCVILSGFFIWLNPKLYNEYLTINDVGISCCQSGETIWEYKWDAIARLQRSSRYLLPSMEIMIETVYRGEKTIEHSGHYFQLSRAAKEALARYYTQKEENPK